MRVTNSLIAILLLAALVAPVSYVLIVVLSSPGLEYKEFVYVDGKEIERLDLYTIIPILLVSFIPFVVATAVVCLMKLVFRGN